MFRDFWNMLKRDRVMMILVILLLIEGPVMDFLSGGIPGLIRWFVDMVMVLPAILIGLSLHEFAHARMALYWGDPTPLYQGRVTLDPRAHIDPVGLLALIFLRFGWGRPVMVDPRNYRDRRKAGIMVGLAGIGMNFLVAVCAGFCIMLAAKLGGNFIFQNPLGKAFGQVFINIVYMNIFLMMFNLLPVPPLDGYNVVGDLFEVRGKTWYQNLYFNSRFILMLMILLRIPSRLISMPSFYLVNFIMSGLFRVTSWPLLLM